MSMQIYVSWQILTSRGRSSKHRFSSVARERREVGKDRNFYYDLARSHVILVFFPNKGGCFDFTSLLEPVVLCWNVCPNEICLCILIIHKWLHDVFSPLALIQSVAVFLWLGLQYQEMLKAYKNITWGLFQNKEQTQMPCTPHLSEYREISG